MSDAIDARPREGVAVVTCMDARIDALGVLGLRLGDAHVLRNAGGRVTDDVIRSLRLSVSSFGVSTIVLMQHTRCGTAIDDHLAALCDDIDLLVSADIEHVDVVAGLVYDVDVGEATELVRCERPNRSWRDHSAATARKHEFATLRR